MRQLIKYALVALISSGITLVWEDNPLKGYSFLLLWGSSIGLWLLNKYESKVEDFEDWCAIKWCALWRRAND